MQPMSVPSLREPLRWWQRGAIYQIYPRSFQDSDGDGVGDLPGITSRLDHVASLGVEAIWLSPFYRSPMADFGYDVSDYTDVDPLFGTLADFDTMLAEAHARGVRVVVDWVPNHSSDQHPWFVESRSGRDRPQARLVRLARRAARRRSAEQLALSLRGPRLDARRGERAVLPALVPAASSLS